MAYRQQQQDSIQSPWAGGYTPENPNWLALNDPNDQRVRELENFGFGKSPQTDMRLRATLASRNTQPFAGFTQNRFGGLQKAGDAMHPGQSIGPIDEQLITKDPTGRPWSQFSWGSAYGFSPFGGG